ncbi:MAG: hypothetical protein AUK47_17330 [Deltaproteobacteria bacterium CG2_30_63_29]|nr:MAG: hypothetical protein AUK47_17330 [Deltaproteobacteria bacterium CG2_30_63_29]
MRPLLAFLFVLALMLPLTAQADEVRSAGNFGLGLGGGTGTSGLSMKYFVNNSNAFQGVVGVWGLGRNHGSVIGLSADYLWEGPALASGSVLELGWNIGLGAFAGTGDAFWLGAAGVLGLEFNFRPIPIDIVLEYRPGLLILERVDADLINFGGHLRYYF